jgi:hypothetical protein
MSALFEVPRLPEGGDGGAVISTDRRYRYNLWRTWDDTLPVCGWVMLNPSTADETKLDPTLRRVRDYCCRWGFGGFVVRNLFALRATDPRELVKAADRVGPENDAWLHSLTVEVDRVVVGWGTGRYPRLGKPERWAQVAAILSPARPVCLSLAKDGQPCHPLYQRADAEPFTWYPAVAA